MGNMETERLILEKILSPHPMVGYQTLKKGLAWELLDGKTIRFCIEDWLGNGASWMDARYLFLWNCRANFVTSLPSRSDGGK